jgi:hypothetical protein
MKVCAIPLPVIKVTIYTFEMSVCCLEQVNFIKKINILLMYELCFCSSINVRPTGLLKDIDEFLRKNNFQTVRCFRYAESHGGRQFTVRVVDKCDMNLSSSKM